MRIVKDAEERKNEILDAAEKLFSSKGFDNTSTNDILNSVGIARGTLYYHFKSKEDILDAVIQRITQALISKATAIAADQSLPVLERLTGVILALHVDSNIGNEVLHQVHKPQNALLHQKMQKSLLSGIVPIITQLVQDGIRHGIFNTNYPAEAVEMLMLYSNAAFDELAEQTSAEREQRMKGFIYNTERILGVSEGDLRDTLMRILL